MNNPEQEFEKILRAAPQPRPASGLKEKLMNDAVSTFRKSPGSPAVRVAPPGWFRRWWPALAPATVSVACAVVLTLQRLEITDLKTNLRALTPAAQVQPPQPASQTAVAPADGGSDSASTVDELTRLRKLAAELTAEVAALQQMKTDNEDLRAQLAAHVSAAFAPEEVQAMNDAMARAQAINCVNNLKQIGLAARVWALDNADLYPTNFLSMSNELSTPKILVCPADTNRVVASNFSTYSDANCSYEFFKASDTEPTQVLCRCPIHGSIGLADGSVHMGVAKKHPDWLVHRDGKLYYEMPAEPAAVTPSNSSPP